jgi:uncharacterized membrane protein YiaA
VQVYRWLGQRSVYRYLLIGLIQGLVFWWHIAYFERGHSPGAAGLRWADALAIGVGAGGLSWQLMSARLRPLRAFAGMALLTLVCTFMMMRIGWPPAHARDWSPQLTWVPSMVLIWYIGTAFVCAYQNTRASFPEYPDLYRHAWNNVFIIFLALLITGVFWGLLALCATLFGIIKVAFFSKLFFHPAFVWIATPLVFSVGIRLGRENDGVIAMMRGILLAVCRGLLPLGAAIAVGFTLTLPFSGLHTLWQTGRTTPILLFLIAVTLWLVNGVFQDGQQAHPYPRALRRLTEASLVALPVLAAIAGYSVYLRVAQYGLSPARFVAGVATAVAAWYALCALWAVLRPGRIWLQSLRRSNVGNAALVCLVLMAMHTPWMNADETSAHDRYRRLLDPAGTADARDYAYLRDQLGAPGGRYIAKLDGLLAGGTLPAAEQQALNERKALAVKDDGVMPLMPEEPPHFRLQWAGPELAGLDAFDPYDLRQSLCNDGICAVRPIDLDGDGQDELLIAPKDAIYAADIYARGPDGRYARTGRMEKNRMSNDSLFEALLHGDVKAVEPRYKSLQVGSQRLEPRITPGDG